MYFLYFLIGLNFTHYDAFYNFLLLVFYVNFFLYLVHCISLITEVVTYLNFLPICIKDEDENTFLV